MGISLVLIVLGILASASVIVKMKPEAKRLIAVIEPFQGWIGVACFVWGLINIMNGIRALSYPSLVGPFIFAAVATMILLGLLMGFGLISKYALSRNELALAKGEMLRSKLATIQIPLGFAAIGIGVATIVL